MEDIIKTLSNIDLSIKNINQDLIIMQEKHFWDTQWFSVLIGAVLATIISIVIERYKDRKNRVIKMYNFMLKNYNNLAPLSLYHSARMHKYGYKSTRSINGEEINEEKADKGDSEKLVIEFRKIFKYWYMPFSSIKTKLKKYENLLKVMDFSNFKPSEEKFKILNNQYEIIKKDIFGKTGESEYTV